MKMILVLGLKVRDFVDGFVVKLVLANIFIELIVPYA